MAEPIPEGYPSLSLEVLRLSTGDKVGLSGGKPGNEAIPHSDLYHLPILDVNVHKELSFLLLLARLGCHGNIDP